MILHASNLFYNIPLAATGNEAYQKPFRPLIGDVVFAEFNDIESVKKLVSENTCAKAIGGGVPVGALCAKGEFAEALTPGDHGTTYGCNPFATNAVNTVFKIFREDKVLENVNAVAPYLIEQLDKFVSTHDSVIARRGMV